MTQYKVKTLKKPVSWITKVPGSKSMTNRALLLSALSDGPVQLNGVLFSEDSRCFLNSLISLGFDVIIEEEKKTVTVVGCGGQIPKQEADIYVGSAGTAARFLTAMLGFSSGIYTIGASQQMKRRPMMPLFGLLTEAGAKIIYLEQEGFLPVRIIGCRYSDSGKDCKCDSMPLTLDLDISRSTQFLSALLLISPMIKHGFRIHITSEKKDGSYIRITRNMMKEFGADVQFDGADYTVPAGSVYHRSLFEIEPDMSAACYFYAAAAVTGGHAVVKNVHFDNTQGDVKFLGVLERMGCTVEDTADGIAVTGPKEGALHGLSVDMNDFSDQALTLAAIAPYADSPVSIRNIGHIRKQESDRIKAIVGGLESLGICCEEEEDAVTIHPGLPHGGVIDTYEDHRVAMAFSLAGLRTEGVVIDNPDCCAKTFENYFDILTELLAREV